MPLRLGAKLILLTSFSIAMTAEAGAAAFTSRPPAAGSVAQGVPFSASSRVQAVGDGAFDLKALRGSIVVMSVWASWCAPCVAELSEVEALSRQLSKEGVVVVPLSVDRGGPWAIARAYSRAGVTSLPLIWDDPARVTALFKIRSLPTTLVIDPAGRVVARFDGQSAFPMAQVLEAIDRTKPSTRHPMITHH